MMTNGPSAELLLHQVYENSLFLRMGGGTRMGRDHDSTMVSVPEQYTPYTLYNLSTVSLRYAIIYLIIS